MRGWFNSERVGLSRVRKAIAHWLDPEPKKELIGLCRQHKELVKFHERAQRRVAMLEGTSKEQTAKIKSLNKHVIRLETELKEARQEPVLAVPVPREGMPHFQFFLPGVAAGNVYGGPYMHKPEGIHGVKMAEEIDLPCTINVPTRDFSIPREEDLMYGLIQAVILLRKHGELYVGCMGGRGRTGIFMAALVKIMTEAGVEIDPPSMRKMPKEVAFVRMNYNQHAVETDEQMKLIKNLNVAKVLDTLRLIS